MWLSCFCNLEDLLKEYFSGPTQVFTNDQKNQSVSVPGTTRLPSAEFPLATILCITLSFLPIPNSGASLTLAVWTGAATAGTWLWAAVLPVRAETLEAMKAREFLQKGNNHLTRLEFQLALDAYTECLVLEPNNRTAKENIVLTHNNWGIYWFQKRKYKEAREEWEQALKLNPADRNARNNMQILRVTLSRQGLTDDGEKKQAPPKANTDFPPSQVIILTPGIKSSNSAGSAAGAPGNSTVASPSGAASNATGGSFSTAPADGASAPASTDSGYSSSSASGSGAAVIIKTSKTGTATTSGGGATAGITAGANSSDSASAASSASGASSSYPSGVSTYGDPAPGKFTTAPLNSPTVTGTTAATAGGSQGDNIEESLAQIELKIYGRKQDSLPIMKRLEKLETDTHGKTKSGTIKERIDTLRKSYGF